PLPTRNFILDALSPDESEHLATHLEPVAMRAGEVLYDPEEPVTHVYFPSEGTVSVVSVFEDGGGVEVSMVGNEGMFGINVVLGSVTAPLKAVVQLGGGALRMRADVVRREFLAGGQFHDVLLRYTQAFIIQIAQTAACNRSHPLGGRLARWLLMSHDRASTDDLQLTHEFIAVMLGTRRAGVSEAAGKLQDDGVIKYKRGHVRIIDRQRLESISCECYPAVKREFDRLLGDNAHAH
ncbi:MAG TPA: Crp/Fnr family transcriptional regulator, partial [Pyrinomonadaceae bacterium]